mgnify:CR=1 FL=1
MLEKNKHKQERKARELWNAYYPRTTPTKHERAQKAERKHRNRGEE